MCCTRLAANTGRKISTKIRHLGIIAQLCQAKQQIISSTYSHNMANFGRLAAEIGSGVSGPSKFQRAWRLAFVTAATSLIGGQSNFARRLSVSWLLHYIFKHFRGALAPWRNFVRCKVHFTSKSCVLLYWQRYYTALQQLAKVCGVVHRMELRNFRRGRHLYSAGRPPCWASAHIYCYCLMLKCC